VPLDAGGQRYGLLQLGPHREDRPYSDAEGEALQQVAAQVAQALSLAWPRYINDLQIRRASTQQSTQN
jgi:GAF domain-containing protein